MFSGLQELGIASGDDLKETLTNCTEPLRAIDQFQVENGILLPSLQSALPFLDLHSIPRLEFHQSVFDELREKLLDKIATIASEGKDSDRYNKLEDLLGKCFPLVKVPSIQPVVMCVMKHLPKVPEEKLKLVMADKELYKICATEVKRQIWQDNQALFGDEVSPLLKQYIIEKENALFSSELSVLHNFFSASPKTRRQGEVVQKLTNMIGKNVKLYDMVLQFLRTLFLRTRNVHYCTLRAELLMSLHDLDISEICSVDPCHKDSPDLLLLLRMLSLGQGAWDMIDSQVFKEPKMEIELITKFLPNLMAFVVDDHTFNVDQKLPTEEKVSNLYPASLPESFIKFILENRVACEIALYYVLHITKQRNKNAILRLLPSLVETYNGMAFSDIFLHLFTSHLTLLTEEFTEEDFCTALFDGFILATFSSKENVHRHVLRLLLHLHHKIAPSKMISLQKALEPTKQSTEAVKELYTQLTEKMESVKQSPVETMETPALELPLRTVSTPAAVI
ncbi:negative elongation factor B isoform X3 [Mobula hypostoma]|uniref:negative elongation factor B isoform X3 n=1 Tax=Mobula hypostoma TaxID=723540 RepID=UPI002FC3731C